MHILTKPITYSYPRRETKRKDTTMLTEKQASRKYEKPQKEQQIRWILHKYSLTFLLQIIIRSTLKVKKRKLTTIKHNYKIDKQPSSFSKKEIKPKNSKK